MNWNSGRLWLRIIVYTALALLALGTVTEGLIFWQFDEAAVRRSIGASLSDTGRQVQIEGSITPRVFPFPGIDADNITISQPNSPVPVARIARMEARLAWWPLLFGQREVRSLTLYAPNVDISRNKDGTLSIADLFSRREQRGFHIDLNTLIIHDGVLSYQDDASGERQRLSAIAIDADGLKSSAMFKAGAILDDDTRPLNLSIVTPLTIDDKRLDLSQIDAQVESDTPALGKTQLNITGALHLDLNNFSAAGEDLAFAFTTEQPQSSATLRVPYLDANLERVQIPQSHLSATMQYERSHYQLEANLTSLNITRKAMNARRLSGEFNWQVGDNRVKLTLDAPFTLAGLSDLQLAPLTLTAQAITPLLPRGQLIANMQGALTGALKDERFDLHGKGKIDGSDIALDVTQFGLIHPRHEVALSIGALDLNRYLPETKGEAVAIFQNKDPIPLDWMDFFDLNGKLNIGELSVGRFRTNDVSASVRVLPQEMELNQISANIYTGRLQGDASLKRGPVNRYEVRQTLRGMSIRPLLVDLFNFGQLDGKGNGQVALTAHGDSFVDLRNSLGGEVQMSLNQGALTGIDLVSALKNLPAELKEMNAPARANQKTTFSTLQASFHMDQGVGRNQDLTLASQLVNVNGGGKIDLRHSIIDYNMNVAANPREFTSLRGVSIPLKITGPLNAPVYALNFNAMVKGKKTETEKQQALKQELKKQITTILP
ncbi:MAG: AsmA family protein [Paludibacterium sp.]|uniref:AsmA family protein n=1 Tax=Paludibacterium sp. TaxID=1917523 RepID=UPI0025F6ADB3|nr:AsmA family protein [Paludibacterium sp.]MBV8048649.1 AsmA family protein [Paludibacterium sp.]MBV8645769.1 AsmA family protein [Paludibacterium sp.]